MNGFQNLDLLSVGIAIAGIGILGFIVFLSDKKSATNRTFLAFALSAILWSSFNYAYYEFSAPSLVLWLLRIHAFFAVWYTFFLFQLFYVFPKEKVEFPKLYKRMLVPVIFLSSAITLTPLVFREITAFSTDGKLLSVSNGPAIILFGATITFLLLGGLITLFIKFHGVEAVQRKQFGYVLTGALITFLLHITFNFILPAFFNNPRYIPFGAVFIFPVTAFTYYAVIRHHLLKIKVITTEVLTFVLAVTTFAEIIYADNLQLILFRIGVFVLVMSFGILLIKSVRREVEQREQLQKLTEELSIANEKLKALDVQKSQFLSFASHDLKSPINIIKQFATLIADGTYKEPQKITETIQKIKSTADRATHLVDDFLDIRKIEEGHMDYTFETKDIVPFVKGITEDYALLAKAEKNIGVTFESKISSTNVKVDTNRFRQVVQNLLSNSLKYTEAGWIKVSLIEEQKSVLITVKDSGLGMDKQLLPILFEQFRRDPSVAKKIQGTGLGLYISKQIVLAHHGEIWAESDGKGFGSTFLVRLPKA
jgi:signal transduction histidine kinase